MKKKEVTIQCAIAICSEHLLQRKVRFEQMEEMFLNKASGLRRQFFCNPAQSEQMLLK